MKKLTLLSLAALAIFTGCNKSEITTSLNGKIYKDDLGREVAIEKAERVSILTGSFADIWSIAGGKDTIVSAAEDTWTQFDLGLGEDVRSTGAVRAPNLEEILGSNPDLVIGSSKIAAEVNLKETFQEMGIPVLYFDVSNFNDYLRMLDVCTDITGHKENYKKYGLSLQKEINKAKAFADGSNPTVLYVRASTSKVRIKNSQDSVLGEMLKDLGCINIADSNEGLLENLSMETIIKEDPDWIFGVLQSATPEKAQAALEKALLSDPAWAGLTAVKEGRFIMLDQRLYNMKPNARWAEAYKNLAEIIYEEK